MEKTLFGEMVELYESGLSQKEVAKKLGVTRMTVRWAFKKNNYKGRSVQEAAKLKEEDPEIRRTKRTWHQMKSRCERGPEYPRYSSYGGKGIEVCERWEVFENFLEDMGVRPKGLSIDRIDNSKGYYKDNCRWATSKQQQNNRDFNVLITISGETNTISEWSDKTGIPRSVISSRFKRGWSEHKLLNPDNNKNRYLEFKGERKTLLEWAEELGLSPGNIRSRLSRGKLVEEALTKPLDKRQRLMTALGMTKSEHRWSQELGLPKSTIRNRKRRGWTDEEALFTPVNKKHRTYVE